MKQGGVMNTKGFRTVYKNPDLQFVFLQGIYLRKEDELRSLQSAVSKLSQRDEFTDLNLDTVIAIELISVPAQLSLAVNYRMQVFGEEALAFQSVIVRLIDSYHARMESLVERFAKTNGLQLNGRPVATGADNAYVQACLESSFGYQTFFLTPTEPALRKYYGSLYSRETKRK